MELWNDFEGKTVDGRFRLDHLIGPKGRSAYFRATEEAGGPVTIRLIESLNDEQEILGRWRLVSGWKQEHLVEVLACGQTVLDGTHLVYAVMEPTDMELADVLREGTLGPDETGQIAMSVADGLAALHAKGLVHEHVEADNVLARGETVKLRSDVVREAPEGAEGDAVRAADVRDLCQLLTQCLTRSRRLGEAPLPGRFDEIVRKGESGVWGLKEIRTVLGPMAPANRGTVPAGTAPAATASRPGVAPVAPARPAATGAAVAAGVAGAAAATAHAPAAVASRLANQGAGPGAGASDGVGAHVRTPRAPDRIMLEPEDEPKRRGLLVAIGLGILLLAVVGFYFLRAGRSRQQRSVVQDNSSAVTVPQQSEENRPPLHDPASAPVPQPAEAPAAAAATTHAAASRDAAVVTAATAPSGNAEWRVVAFTYNRESQAAQKAQAIGSKHPGLRPEVFSPSGGSPYLVSLGGWMSQGQAFALRAKARAEGLPRDTYARNYRHRTH